MTFALHIPTMTLGTADADMVAPELRASQPPSPAAVAQGAPLVTCPANLDLRTVDRVRIRNGIGLNNPTINGYRDNFVARRMAQGDRLALEHWLDQVACSVVKQYMLDGHLSADGDWVVCPQGQGASPVAREAELRRVATEVKPRYWVRAGVVLREANAGEKVATDTLPENVNAARTRKESELRDAFEKRMSLRRDARLLLRKVRGESGADIDAAVTRQTAAEALLETRLAAVAAATTVPQIEAIEIVIPNEPASESRSERLRGFRPL